VSDPARNVLGVHAICALLGEAACVPFEVAIPLEVVNLDEDEAPFKGSEGPEVFDFPSTIVEAQKFVLELEDLAVVRWKDDEMTKCLLVFIFVGL